jgi:four helix bundle protein
VAAETYGLIVWWFGCLIVEERIIQQPNNQISKPPNNKNMPTVKRFEDLQVWQQARELDQLVFKLTQKPVISRDYRLIDQWRAASGSIMDNIAEGFDREGRKEFLQFLSIAKGSTGEVRSQAYRTFDRNYLTPEEFEQVYK